MNTIQKCEYVARTVTILIIAAMVAGICEGDIYLVRLVAMISLFGLGCVLGLALERWDNARKEVEGG